jgi:iron complex outermembrane receptor protein
MRRLVAGLVLCLPTVVAAQMEELDPVDEPIETKPAGAPAEAPPVILEEFAGDARTIVLSAARTRTTIQEAPGIITVITADEIRQRGHRTINDVLRTVPGFEGSRVDSNGWFNEATARGQPRTLLILINGTNVTEPLRNGLTMDRKIPMASVKRIEVTSGPGGVLWGSNALLGVVNIVLEDQSDLDGFEVSAGGGHGPGAQSALGGRIAYGKSFMDGDLKLYLAVDGYSDRGAELEVDAIKVLGVLPAPDLDGKTLYENRSDVTDFNQRDWWLSTTLNLQILDKLTLDAFFQFETDYRQQATGGAVLRGFDREGNEVHHGTKGNDSLQMVGLTWRDRFFEDQFGLSARAYVAHFNLDERPFWAFPPRTLGTIEAISDGVVLALEADTWRIGTSVDADVQIGSEHHLIFGAELFTEMLRNGSRDATLRRRVLIPGLADPMAEDNLARRGIYGPTRCPPTGKHQVAAADGSTFPVEFRDCDFTEALTADVTRQVAALYITDEWKPARSVALQPGFRVQISNTYDPVALLGAAFVWNVVDKTFFKLNYAEGFRPPELQSTSLNDNALSGVTYQSDPDLNVERSRAVEGEINTQLFTNQGALKGVYLRADYAYTVMTDLVRNVGGVFANSGERGIHSAEFLTRVDFQGGHEIWFGGHFVRAEDSVFGPVRNFPNWVFMGGGRTRLFNDHLELSLTSTLVGAQEDLNRAADTGERLLPGFIAANASDIEVDKVDRYLLLRFGVRVINLWEDRLELSAFVYNTLNQQVREPDYFFDDRVMSRGCPREGLSAFGQATVRF